MTVVAVAHGIGPEQLRACLASHAAGPNRAFARRTQWGAIGVIDASYWQGNRWMVVGAPQAHTWGVPGADLAGGDVVAELDRYGPAAIQMTAGPVIAIDLSSGAVLRAVNGIIPVTVSPDSAEIWTASTASAVVADVCGSKGRTIEPGSLASPGGAVTPACGGMVKESLRSLTWSGVEAEIERALAPIDVGKRARLARAPGLMEDAEERFVRHCDVPGRAIFLPPLAGRSATDNFARYRRLRDNVTPRLWFRARLVGLWLCAPAFERPALDLVLSAAVARKLEAPLPA